jgi:hypothetical protein
MRGRVAADFLSFGFSVHRENRRRRRGHRVGKWKTCLWFSTFPGGARLGGGNVKIPPLLRDFQGAVGIVENLLLVFHDSHRPVVSTAPPLR